MNLWRWREKIFLFVIALSLALGFQPHLTPPVASEPAHWLSQLNQVQIAIERGHLRQASRLLEAASFTTLPPEIEPYLRALKGNLALRQGDYRNAISIYKELLASGFEPPSQRLILLNNYVQARLKQEQIYQVQAQDDLERRNKFLSLAQAVRQQAITAAQQAVGLRETGNRDGEIQSRLNLAQLSPSQVDLVQLAGEILSLPPSETQVRFLLDLAPLSPAPLSLLQEAARSAEAVGEPRSRSWALGALGNYYERQENYRDSLRLSQQASWAANLALDWARQAQWQWQVARAYRQLGETERALPAYRLAVKAVGRLRQNLAGERLAQPLYLDTIEPLLRDYLEFLLAQPAPPPSLLAEAVQVVRLNQLAELDNYFGDICQVAVQSTPQQPGTALVYWVMLPSGTKALLEWPDGSFSLFHLPISAADLKRQVLVWRKNLMERFSRSYQRESRSLYEALMRPLVAELEARQLRHLVFVPDGILRSVPMAALYDSQRQQYLVEQFAIGYSLGLGGKLVAAPPPEFPLIAGRSSASRQFPNPLPGAEQETRQLQGLLGGTRLFNEKFTPVSLAAHLKNPDYKLLHLASHGQFTGLAEEALIQTGTESLSLAQFERLLRERQSPLAHLTLSACETATGSRYAALGLAGIGIRSGIASVLGSLWYASDRATADLILDFYHNWRQDERLEEALKQSQIRQIRQGLTESHPANWAAFILVRAN
jgi:CHAT domain-containing protein